MGRKIPARKHRTVKDPYVQRAQEFAKIKNKINNPPSKSDEQEIPKSVLRIMELKQKAKEMPRKIKKRKNKKNIFNMKKAILNEKSAPGMERPVKYLPIIEQSPNEPPREFKQRVHHMVTEAVKESKFETKYSVEVKRDKEGVITEVEQVKAAKKSKKLKLSAKRKERERKKKESNIEPKEFPKREKIEFGNIVHQPPANLTKPRKQIKDVGESFPKPGKRDLLLKKMIGENESAGSAGKKKVINSTLEKQKIEERRKTVVEAFRQLKKGNIKG